MLRYKKTIFYNPRLSWGERGGVDNCQCTTSKVPPVVPLCTFYFAAGYFKNKISFK